MILSVWCQVTRHIDRQFCASERFSIINGTPYDVTLAVPLFLFAAAGGGVAVLFCSPAMPILSIGYAAFDRIWDSLPRVGRLSDCLMMAFAVGRSSHETMKLKSTDLKLAMADVPEGVCKP